MGKFKFKIRLGGRSDLHHMSDRLLLVNLYITQALALVFAILLIVFGQQSNPLLLLAWPADGDVWLWGFTLAASVIALNGLIALFGPEIDDGGVNKKLFCARPLWHIVIICAVVAIAEELLFRGAVQPLIGNIWTSVLFTAIHVRYLRHWLPVAIVFLTSIGLGAVYEHTGSLWAPICAHFTIDFVLGCAVKWKGDHDERHAE